LNFENTLSIFPLDLLAQKSKCQHLAPTVRATNKQPAMAPKRASSKTAPSIDKAAKAALLAEKKGKALTDNTPHEAFEDEAVSKDNTKGTSPLKAPYASAAPEDYHKHHQASLHQRAKTQ
jgi:hypothetical protein